jgi:hypothetical protein
VAGIGDRPGCRSSGAGIPPQLRHHRCLTLRSAEPLLAGKTCGEDRATVLSVLARVADPRARCGMHDRSAAILTLAMSLQLAGARSFTAIVRQPSDAAERTCRVPGAFTFRADAAGPSARRVIAVSERPYAGPARQAGLPGICRPHPIMFTERSPARPAWRQGERDPGFKAR